MGSEGWAVGGWGGTLEFGGGGGGDDATVSNYEPAAGSPISPGTPISFDVTGPALSSITITVFYPDTGASEVCYDLNGFTVNYLPSGSFLGSERHAIAGGLHFILRRRGGWPLSPKIKVQGGTVEGGAIEQ